MHKERNYENMKFLQRPENGAVLYSGEFLNTGLLSHKNQFDYLKKILLRKTFVVWAVGSFSREDALRVIIMREGDLENKKQHVEWHGVNFLGPSPGQVCVP